LAWAPWRSIADVYLEPVQTCVNGATGQVAGSTAADPQPVSISYGLSAATPAPNMDEETQTRTEEPPPANVVATGAIVLPAKPISFEFTPPGGAPGIQVQPYSTAYVVEWRRVLAPGAVVGLGFVGEPDPDSGVPPVHQGNLSVAGCHLVDVVPGAYPNKVERRNAGRVWVAILTTTGRDAATGATTTTFDAGRVDPGSARLGSGDGARPDRNELIDVDADGDRDLRLRFRVSQTGLDCDDRSIRLRARTVNGERLSGSDAVERTDCSA
jgi:hypothetical protein